MKRNKVFLVDDDELILTVLSKSLEKAGYKIKSEAGTEDIIHKIKSWSPDVILLDIDLPGRNGIDILKEIKQRKIDTEIIMMTADDSVETAIIAMKIGAVDYLIKPFDMDEVIIVIKNTIKNKRLQSEVDYYRQVYSPLFEKDLIGQSEAIQELKAKIEKLAEARVETMLITGESGTGKEVTARYVHRIMHGGGSTGYAPFVAINCAALPENILESELFGYEKGSFTDAKSDKKGLFEMAASGTILLDEIGEMRLDLQSKLLRVLEERKIRRLGGKEDIPLAATVIATTNIDLQNAVDKGEFRLDLFYRLNPFTLHMKPLREIQEDIPVLAQYFLSNLSKKYNKKNIKNFSPVAEKLMQSYNWPGNVRELRNTIERIVVLEQLETITPEQLPFRSDSEQKPFVERRKGSGKFILPEDGISLEGLEKDLIKQALERTNNNKTNAAKLLNVSYNTIRWQVKKFNLG